MTERERLIELLNNKIDYGVKVIESQMDDRNNFHDIKTNDLVADYLLENRIIVPPYKIGDTVYYVSRGRIERLKIRNINYSFRDREYYVYLENDRGSAMCIGYRQLIGYKLFNTLEEAEKALKARGKEMGYLNELLSRNPLVIDGDTIRPHHKYTDDLYTGGVKISMNENIKQTNYDCINLELLKGRGE